MDGPMADERAVEAVLTASRAMIAVATRSLGAAAEETTIAQYRTLVVLASRGPQRLVDLAGALGVAPSTAGRMCDRLVTEGTHPPPASQDGPPCGPGLDYRGWPRCRGRGYRATPRADRRNPGQAPGAHSALDR